MVQTVKRLLRYLSNLHFLLTLLAAAGLLEIGMARQDED
jgi:hypothetical protein